MEKELLTKKFIMVDINRVEISTIDKPIIGTEALATCVGILIYSEKHKKAIVGHVASNIGDIIDDTIIFICENNLDDAPLKYKVIPGYYYNKYGILEELENYYSSKPQFFVPFQDDEISNNDIRMDEVTKSYEFAFDSLTGKFVTEQVLFGEDYIKINEDTTNFIMKNFR